MKPVIAIVGRPNVGKSTLFNCLTRTRDALVADQPGLTRDRKYGSGKVGEVPYIVIDTGGLSGTGAGDEESGIDTLMAQQSWLAVEEANIVFFMVDARDGLTPLDEDIAKVLRVKNKNIFLIINKIDGLNADLVVVDFYKLGFEHSISIAASHRYGISSLMQNVLQTYEAETEPEQEIHGIKIAIIGRPNVGKSTLVNRILGEERVVSYDQPGTTRDSIYLPFVRNEKEYTLIDTAGVRRKSKVKQAIEKFSIIKTLQAIDDANVVVILFDGHEAITEQDATILGYVLDSGRALVIGINKWDGIDADQKSKLLRELDVKLSFIHNIKIHKISALHGTGVGELFPSINKAYRSATKKFSTSKLTDLMTEIVNAHQPPLVKGRRIKLRYAHQGGQNPPVFVLHGNQTDKIPESYKRYLSNAFQKYLKLEGTPVKFEFKTGDNPFKGKKNVLTPRQLAKRKRMMRHLKR